ncbi:hypothetical protein SteCoe_22663 [Stentor coeruleus]|uniref:U2A'/phosphoprotein 32 family A C-terminal domain-containing protein n=1 Tax=Stentor coeruleus TaxID=5963 RepID=A0A1R2BLM1_9CILI|nr:hypothetical protein SteCoe_22663 [Stentor coeruleus]
MEGIISSQTEGTDFEEVEELNLESWRAKTISPQEKKILEKYVNLDYLSLSGCGLESLKNFPVLSRLIKLDLNENSIKTGLENLNGLKDLMQLSFTKNKLDLIESFRPLSALTSLVYLDIDGCPVTQIDDYRNKLFAIIPNLQVIDTIDRNGKEVSIFDEDEENDEFGDDDDEDLDEEEGDFDEESDDEEVVESEEEDPRKRKRNF